VSAEEKPRQSSPGQNCELDRTSTRQNERGNEYLPSEGERHHGEPAHAQAVEVANGEATPVRRAAAMSASGAFFWAEYQHQETTP
jgi:hypothetical protein